MYTYFAKQTILSEISDFVTAIMVINVIPFKVLKTLRAFQNKYTRRSISKNTNDIVSG